jgi:predicted DNA-binding transcriptional regulator YafY
VIDSLVIQGGQPLRGEVVTSGAKNAALPILASTILGEGDCSIGNVPRVVDVVTMGKLLRMLERSNKGMRAKELHEALDERVAERTVFRDLVDLQEAGFPLYVQDGTWRVLTSEEGGFSTPLDSTEVLALVLSEELMRPMAGSELALALQALRQKVAAMLPPKGRAYIEDMKQHQLASFLAPADYGERSEDVRLVEQAVNTQQTLEIAYFSAYRHGHSERRLDPYTLWFADGRLYVIGYCHMRKQVQTFLMDRIRSVRLTDDTFDPDPSFDASHYIQRGFGVWSGTAESVELWFSADVAHLTQERRYHASQQVETQDDGSAILRMHASGLPHIASWVAGFGGQVVARQPESLVRMVRELHVHGMAAY